MLLVPMNIIDLLCSRSLFDCGFMLSISLLFLIRISSSVPHMSASLRHTFLCHKLYCQDSEGFLFMVILLLSRIFGFVIQTHSWFVISHMSHLRCCPSPRSNTTPSANCVQGLYIRPLVLCSSAPTQHRSFPFNLFIRFF